MRRRSRRWRACVRVCVRAACGGCPRGAFQCTRREPRRAAVGAAVRPQSLMWGDADFCHEAGPSVQMMRVRFCLEAAEKPSYPAAYGILAMCRWSFCGPLILRCVASPYDGPTGNLSLLSRPRACSTFDGAARRAAGGVPVAVGGLPPCPGSGACRAIPGGRAGRPPVPTLVSSRLRHPRTMCNDERKLAPVRH